MIVHTKRNYLYIVKAVWKQLAFFLLVSCFVAVVAEYSGISVVRINLEYVAVLGTAVGLFLAFRINSGYGRWWEARTIWGDLVNASRAFGMNVSSLLTNMRYQERTSEEREAQKEVIMGHIGFINALRTHLRGQDSWEEIQPYFTTPELAEFKSEGNIPAQIIQLQAKRISSFYDGNPDREFRLLSLMKKLDEFYSVLGGCERIKNTVFPWGYAYYTRLFVWLLATLLPFSLIDGFSIRNILLCSITSFVFVSIERVGSNLDNPFENSFNDIPMSALCRTIEIDLLHQIDERDVPEPLVPEKGVLL